jgi:hypothetical protein
LFDTERIERNEVRLYEMGSKNMSYLRLAVTVFCIAYAVVHVNFLKNFFLSRADDPDIFTKYEENGGVDIQSTGANVWLAKRVYFTKASWMFVLVALQVFARLDVYRSMTISTALYVTELLVLFPASRYIALNALGAVSMIVCWIVDTHQK